LPVAQRAPFGHLIEVLVEHGVRFRDVGSVDDIVQHRSGIVAQRRAGRMVNVYAAQHIALRCLIGHPGAVNCIDQLSVHVFATAQGLGGAFSNVAAGFLATAYGFPATFLTLAAVAGGAFMVFVVRMPETCAAAGRVTPASAAA
jgi:hypothetical protein